MFHCKDYICRRTLNSNLTFPDGTEWYADVKNGERGYNTDPARGADTFHPFRGYLKIASGISGQKTFDLETLFPNNHGGFILDNFIISTTGSLSVSQPRQTNGNSAYFNVTKSISGHILTTSLSISTSGVDTVGNTNSAAASPLYDVYALLT